MLRSEISDAGRRGPMGVLGAVVCTIALIGCDSRATSSGDGAVPDSGRVDRGGVEMGLADQAPTADAAPRLDQTQPVDLMPRPDAATFCAGPPRATINGRELALSGVETSTTVMASCCDAGERIVFVASTGERLGVEVVRFPNVSVPLTPTTVDLASPPSGWVVALRCEPYQDCSVLTAQNADLSGTLLYRTMGTPPRYVVDVCVEAKPKADGSSPPGFSGMRLHAKAATVHRACVVGMDQTCNDDPNISSIRGTCEKNSTCTCTSSQPNPLTGKCP